MTLDALFASSATQAPTEGSLIPLEEMPLGAFKEMVERHLGRELTDDTGRDLAAWLESTLPGGEATPDASAAMAHLLVGMAREEAGGSSAALDAQAEAEPTSAPTTLGARLSALARSIGLPIGRSDDPIGEFQTTQTAPTQATEEGTATDAQQVAARRPAMRAPLTKAQRQAVIAAASSPTAPLVIDLRGEDPFELAALGGGKLSPTGVGVDASSAPDLGAQLGMTTRAAGQAPSPGSTTTQPVSPTADPAGMIQTAAHATAASAGITQPDAGPEATAEIRETVTPRSPLTEPAIRGDVSQPTTARTTTADVQAGIRAQAAPPTPAVVSPMAVERVMRIVELQATAPPPRMAVVEIPELDGLRIMVSITDRGAVSITALGGLTESAQAPFLQSVTTALETQGFLLDERNRGRSEEQRENPDRGRPDRDQPRRRPRPDGLFA